MDPVAHFYPDAIVIFAIGFERKCVRGGSPSAYTEADIIGIAQNFGWEEQKEISSIAITKTIKGSPGTFSLTLIDTNNKFIEPDNPDVDIKNAAARSGAKLKSVQIAMSEKTNSKGQKLAQSAKISTATVVTAESSVSYPYTTFNTWKEDYDYGIIVDGITYPLAYHINNAASPAQVDQRWVFLAHGKKVGYLIKVISSAADEVAFQAAFQNTDSIKWSLAYEFSPATTVKSPPQISVEVFRRKRKNFLNLAKDVYEQGIGEEEFQKGRCKIHPMDRVIIFLPERFGDPDNPRLVQAFTGVVNTVQQGYSGNSNTISVTGEDVTKYLRTSYIVTNAALQLFADMPDQTSDDGISIWNNIFKGLTAPDIVKILLLGSTEAAVQEYGNRKNISPVYEYKVFSSNESKGKKYDLKKKQWVEADTRHIEKGVPVDIAGNVVYANFKDIVGDLFQASTVHVIDPFVNANAKDLKGFRAPTEVLNLSWSFYQADFKTRAEIIRQLADDTGFDFFADGKGDIWFRPKRFDFANITCSVNPEMHIARTESIISYAFVEDDSQIFTSVYAYTDPPFALSKLESTGLYRGAWRDDQAVLQFGQRLHTIYNPLIRPGYATAPDYTNKIKSNSALNFFAKSILQRLLANQLQGQVEVTGRPELEPGNLLYIPIRNMVYYVETVDIALTFGERYSTTYHLAYGRKPWGFLPELLSFSAADDIYISGTNSLPGTAKIINIFKDKKAIDETDKINYNIMKNKFIHN